MNIFILDNDRRLSIQYHTDKHIVKIPLEGAQLLCSTLHFTGQAPSWIYKYTHKNNPCSVWARESLSNWLWLQEYVILMGEEYQHRYGSWKTHSSCEVAKNLPRPNIPDKGITPFVKAVPAEFKHLPTVEAYREYFKAYKNHIKKYTNRPVPYWWE